MRKHVMPDTPILLVTRISVIFTRPILGAVNTRYSFPSSGNNFKSRFFWETSTSTTTILLRTILHTIVLMPMESLRLHVLFTCVAWTATIWREDSVVCFLWCYFGLMYNAPLPGNGWISDSYKGTCNLHLVMNTTYAQHAHYVNIDEEMGRYWLRYYSCTEFMMKNDLWNYCK